MIRSEVLLLRLSDWKNLDEKITSKYVTPIELYSIVQNRASFKTALLTESEKMYVSIYHTLCKN